MQSNAFPGDEPQSPEEAVIGLLMQAGRRLRTRHPEDEVDPSTFPLAKQLMCHDGMRLSDLAAKVELDASTVSRQIKQLEDKGLVERTPDPDDGRASLIQLSNEGHRTMQAAFRRRFERIKTVLDPWSQRDKDLLQDLLTRLAADLREANDRQESSVSV
ncbi:MAG: MarR family transcriptional regulator [Nocardioidaceae bacterium]